MRPFLSPRKSAPLRVFGTGLLCGAFSALALPAPAALLATGTVVGNEIMGQNNWLTILAWVFGGTAALVAAVFVFGFVIPVVVRALWVYWRSR